MGALQAAIAKMPDESSSESSEEEESRTSKLTDQRIASENRSAADLNTTNTANTASDRESVTASWKLPDEHEFPPSPMSDNGNGRENRAATSEDIQWESNWECKSL